jgi:hypothetical protein
MSRPFRRYAFHLAERLGKTVNELYRDLNSVEIAEWMAFDKTCDNDWLENYNKELELKKSQELSREEYIQALKSMFGVRGN